MVRVGINGFGRIGRQALKAMLQRAADVLEVVAINDLVDAEMNAYLFKYDSNYGVYPGTVAVRNGNLVIDGREIRVFREREPGAIPWREVGVELVLESTGLFTDAKRAAAHLEAGARRVIISAPAKNEDITIVLGVNEDRYDPARHRIVSNASCTTNGLAPVARVLHEEFGIEKGILTTVHAYTNTQRLLDVAAREMRDARAAALNIVPSETGAARAVGLVIPDLQGKFTGMAFRVPTSTVSVIDFTVLLRRDVTREEINAVMKRWSEERMPEILGYTEEPLVSSDLKGDPRSSIFSAPDTLVVGGNLAKVVSWYDNEWGYACRCADLAKLMAERGI
ncbi:MAG: type I glyceraldehyde-3-phosphate dehydrogenase [Armatimonadota bacterium]|nr:type I glyceraldehyde-3-phosphate dehydrogenase [Armatimonadota bacterium]MDR7443460.1 type I glyceraldehyde-3-phosphate dehydrogenase [Armatimonadota bacterium]MDR7569298.1 type I glyceraldehyde-3-phosphate dehydrogenase [Armatimonadota bacterium]MDR7614958.1 type I glyceraldehyde-3-phosphate dehydrogenase [Armatimonadota bacterium]